MNTALVSSIVLMIALPAGSVSSAREQSRVIRPQGQYSTIDTKLANQTIERLNSGSRSQRLAAAAAIRASPQKYAPPVFYVLSSVLYDLGEKGEAMFWFYAGQLRARIDANCCADESAREAVQALNEQFGPTINKHAFRDIVELESTVKKVLDWDKTTGREYDRRWINLHGMNAVMNDQDTPLSIPKTEWAQTEQKTREDYEAGFRQALEQVKERNGLEGQSGQRVP